MIYRTISFLLDLALRVFFRRMEVEGLEKIPESGPVIFLPNHINALVDALVILRYVKRPVYLTAKSTLAEYRVINYMMKSAQVIRFYRKQDQELGADRSKNVLALAECLRRLEEGSGLCIFPEGQSHSDPSLRPFRWGAARLALEYNESNSPAGSLNLVPVGLHFPRKGLFRSDVWVRFGDPVDVKEWKASNPDGGPEDLTTEVEKGVRKLTLNFEQREESILLNWAAEVLITGGLKPKRIGRRRTTVAQRQSLVMLMKERYDILKVKKPGEIEKLRLRLTRYRSELKQLGLEPAEIYIVLNVWRATLFMIRELAVIVWGFPFAAWGALNHFIPYQLVRLVALRFSREKDQVATNVVFTGVVIFPIFYLAQITVAWLYLPTLWAGSYTLTLPFFGYLALLYRDRVGAILQRGRAFMKFLWTPGLQKNLISEGRSIIEDLQRLGDEL